MNEEMVKKEEEKKMLDELSLGNFASITFRLEPLIVDRLKQISPNNTSRVVRDILQDATYTEVEIAKRIKEHEAEIEKLNVLLKKIREEGPISLLKLSKAEEDYLNVALDIIYNQNKWDKLPGQTDTFNNIFGHNLKMAEFGAILHRFYKSKEGR